MTAFGTTLRAIRESRPPDRTQRVSRECLTRTALARRMGLDHSFVVRYESGDRVPCADNLARILAALSATDAEILALVRALMEDET